MSYNLSGREKRKNSKSSKNSMAELAPAKEAQFFLPDQWKSKIVKIKREHQSRFKAHYLKKQTTARQIKILKTTTSFYRTISQS